MKIAELNTCHFSPETLNKIANCEFKDISSLSWFKEGIVLYIKEEYKTDISQPFDLVNVIGWIKKNKYKYVLVSKDAPVLNSLIRFSDDSSCNNS